MHPSFSSRCSGALLGGAVGDALGAAVEFMQLDEIRSRFGSQGIVEYAEVYGRRGAITDDTQMTLFCAEGLIRSASASAQGRSCAPLVSVHRSYLRWLHTQAQHSAHPDYEDAIDGWLVRTPSLHSRRAPGNTCLSALSLAQPGTIPHPINDSKGCGGVMRIAPVGLWDPVNAFDFGCKACALTHGHPFGYLAGGFAADLIARLLDGTSIADATAAALQHHRPALGPEFSELLERACELASRPEVHAEELESLGEGWVAEEALAMSLCCALHARDFDHGVQLAVNHSGDSDSTGAITGNILGAAHGLEAIATHWLEDLELCEEIRELADDLSAAVGGAAPDPARYPPH